MSKVVVNQSITADGYAAGPDQTEDRPFGDDGGDGWGSRLHAWMFDDADENRAEIAQASGATAHIMGRNMFGPVRGEWDRPWNGWWGEDPPFHGPVYVLTHHARAPQPMAGGTTYHFVTDGPASALARARDSAGDGDICIQGGAQTINQFLAAGLVDEMRLHVVPYTLGGGARLFDDVPPLDLRLIHARAARSVLHVTYRVHQPR
ncbi:dihydrofolate reductase family protein [Tsukamurella tyrosinosolvens]|uniref:dihydrofolate reductase family protein n=1 Tax=Tsukamurella tyrosinosolvens TaxID=57704 RepID=UPI0007936B67|nr:dihydrofolate reductase family protein [Tsukamurella tyrosinosolvens]KXP09051.1 riboflavin biosynthesis protein RibD [Tsukamurella tyrosinosolvens]KZL97377.1 riboflavin biosynthesis protein RibD [Tsukamurella tyrosinosolvens]MCA4997027.1 dihydrofolate reductase family protein [Tsukamurella tyrosinosolvens]QRY86395.1 dihydrofolate reductase family protein [Tsukamurella tyrosinosolvens]